MSLIRGLHHIALATPAIDGALSRTLSALGIATPLVWRAHPGVHSLIGLAHAGVRIEWISPLGGRPRPHPVLGVSNAYPPLHHVAFAVRRLDDAAHRVPLVHRGTGADGHPIAFVDPKATEGLILELVEVAKDKKCVY